MAHSNPPDAVPRKDDLFAGTPYSLVRPLGRGGMGDVFIVAHRTLGKRFVAKVPRLELAQYHSILDRLRVEAESLARLLDSPHIVTIQGHGQLADGRPFFVTEYLHGRTLADELEERGQLAVNESLDLACQLLRALEDAHALGIVHRDIKPGNLFLCAKPHGGHLLKVLDFGLARIMPDAPEGAPQPLETLTDTGIILGTPRYISPEAALGLRVDPRADVYAAALVLYRMLAGRGPFDHVLSDELVLLAHAVEDPHPPSQYAKEPIPPELDQVLLHALGKERAGRFQTALELRGALERMNELLLQPQGWLETSAFDLASLSNLRRDVDASPIHSQEHLAADDRRTSDADQEAAREGLLAASNLDHDDSNAPFTDAPEAVPSQRVRLAVFAASVIASVLVTVLVFKLWGVLP